jgi:hypothetical protein
VKKPATVTRKHLREMLTEVLKAQAKPLRAEFARLYDCLYAIEERLDAIDDGVLGLDQQRATIKTLAYHCHRLLREKETLMTLHDPETLLRLAEANRFVASPITKPDGTEGL